jgi:hypothetical protein
MSQPPRRARTITDARKSKPNLSQDMWQDEDIPAFLRTPLGKIKPAKPVKTEDTTPPNS